MAYDQLVASKSELQPAEEFKVYKYRYVIGVIYAVISIQNILMWLIFSPLQTTLQNAYNEKVTTVNLGTILISNIAYIPANFVATYILDTHGLRIGIILGGILTTIGLWIRIFCESGFAYIFIGQCFAGIAQPFFYSTPQKISNVWFGVHERTIATTAIAVSLNIGNALSAFLPQFFVDIHEEDYGIVKSQLRHLMLCMAIVGSVALVITIIFFREKPPTPPSKGAEASKLNYIESLKALMKDRNALIFILGSAASSAGIVTYMSVLQPLVAPFQIDGDQVGNILFISIFIGFIGAAVAGVYVSKTKKFKFSVILLTFLTFAVQIVNYFSALSENAYIFGACFCLYVLFITPVMPLGLETSVEYSFPVAEATSGGVWFVFNQAISTGTAFAVDALIEAAPEGKEKSYTLYSFILMIGYQLVTVIILLFAKDNLKRTKFEKMSLLNGDDSKRSLAGKAVMSKIGGACVMVEKESSFLENNGGKTNSMLRNE